MPIKTLLALLDTIVPPHQRKANPLIVLIAGMAFGGWGVAYLKANLATKDDISKLELEIRGLRIELHQHIRGRDLVPSKLDDDSSLSLKAIPATPISSVVAPVVR